MQDRLLRALRPQLLGVFMVLVLPVCLWAEESNQPLHVQLANGIEAVVYPPQYILDNMTAHVGNELLFLVDEVRYHFITSTEDFLITNVGDGRFHPMSVTTVIEAMAALRMQDAGLQLRVFVLPFPRREVIDSSARADMVFLSPGAREVGDYAVHFTVTHELGHLYQYRWLPDHEVHAWNYYRILRGIEDHSRFNDRAAHRDRPHEIFAEDFRFLYGGPQSTYSGSIENDELTLPSEVEGLEEFMTSLRQGVPSFAARLQSVPNPFNPETEIRVEFDAPPGVAPVRVDVFDARGGLVRCLHRGPVSSRSLRLPWDGRNTAGTAVGSGVYFAQLDFAGRRSSTKLLLLK
jgi:hypothetical protein